MSALSEISLMRLPSQEPSHLRRHMTFTVAWLVFLLSYMLVGCKKEESAHSTPPQVTSDPTSSNESPPLPANENELAANDRPNSGRSQGASGGSTNVGRARPASETVVRDVDSSATPPANPPGSLGSAHPISRTPADAFAAAERLRKIATTASGQGNIEAAYQAALDGWQMTRVHTSNPQCTAIAAELLKALEEYGEQLPRARRSRPIDESKPLSFK